MPEVALNDAWRFGGVYTPGAEDPSFDDSAFAVVTLPHTVTALSWGDWDPAAWSRRWIYRRRLTCATTPGDRVLVDFTGVMVSATVYLNGAVAGSHQGGYLPFTVELTGGLEPGENVLAVVVDGTPQNVPPYNLPGGEAAIDFLQPAGIYRDVVLRVVPPTFIADVFAQPTTVLSDPGLSLQIALDSATLPTEPVTLAARLLDRGQLLGEVRARLAVTAPGITTQALRLADLTGIDLWSPESPRLYDVQVTTSTAGATHTFATQTGFREAVFELDGFHLNGARYPLFGLNRHQLFPYLGMAAGWRLQRRDAEIIRRQLNCNMVRCSHYPQSEWFLDACDELGLMVWQEPPGWGYVGDEAFQALVRRDVRDMVLRDRSRPSVIVWATRLNETSSVGNDALYAQTTQVARMLDPTRQTTGAMDQYTLTAWNQHVFAYDDYTSAHHHTQATLRPPIEGVPYLVSEAVGALDGAPLYRWIDSTQTLALQAVMHGQVHDLARGDGAYAGLLGWCAFDYASLNGGNRIWHALKWAGVMDTFRVPKPGAALYRSQTPDGAARVILPVFFWDFSPSSPADGPGARAMIATNCAALTVTVEGRAPLIATPDRTGFPHLAHPPVFVDLAGIDGASLPDLLIEGHDAGDGPVARVRMSSDPGRDHLELTIEDSVILGDGSDATRFTVRAVDAYGNQRPYVAGNVTLSLGGPATLLADNPFPFAEYGGIGGGFIRSQPGAGGAVTLTAIHPSLGQATATLTVEALGPDRDR